MDDVVTMDGRSEYVRFIREVVLRYGKFRLAIYVIKIKLGWV